MDTRDMKYIITVVEEGYLTKAAEKLHTTQPNISRVINKIEKDIGISLFNKNKQPWSLTYAGELFVKRTKEITGLHQILITEMNDIKQFKHGRIVLGAMFFEEKYILPKVLPAFKRKYPHVEVRILQDISSNLEKMIIDDKLDFSIVILPISHSNIEYIPVHTYDIFLALPLDYPIAQEALNKQLSKDYPVINPVDLQDTPLIILKEGKPLRKVMLEIAKKCDFDSKCNIAFEANNFETANNFVSNGYGATLAIGPTATEHKALGKVLYFKMENPALTENELKQTIAFAYKKDKILSEQEEYFLELLKKVRIET